MRKLSKAQLTEKAELVRRLKEARETLEKAVEEYNGKLEEIKAPLTEALEAFNGVVTDANQWLADIKSAMEDYVGERTEKWQEGEAGQNFNEWMEQFTEEFEEVEVELPEPVEEPDCGYDETLEERSDEVGSST